MKTIVNTTTVVNFKFQTFLFAFSIIMHVAGSVISASHPMLSVVFAILESVGWTCILLIWGIALIKGIQKWCPVIWTKVGTYARTQACAKKAKTATVVPIEQLKQVRNDVQRLGLALYGTTPELENTRRTHLQMLGDDVPALVLPSQHAVLHAEFQGLVKMLNHFGFPHLESVRLQQKDFAFIQRWGSDLEARLCQQQQHSVGQQSALLMALATTIQQHQLLGQQYASAQQHPGYLRIQGALRFLEKMDNDSRCPWDLAHCYVQALQQDMHTLAKHFEQTVV